MTAQSSSTMTPITTRRVIGGAPDANRPGFWLITLDGDQIVETDSRDIFEAAKRAKIENREVEIDLEVVSTGGERIVELNAIVDNPAPAAQQPTQPQPRTQAIARPAAPAASTLARTPDIPHELILDPQRLTSQLQAMQQHYNVLSPAIAISQMAPGFGANFAVVLIDPTVTIDEYGNGTGPDTYFSKKIHKGNERSLNKGGLQKISQALGIQWDRHLCRPMHDPRIRNYWMWQYIGYVRTHDGQWQTVEGTRELDLRDGAAEAQSMTANQLPKARAMGNQICETKAMQRAIRTFVRQKYTVDELKKPFVIVRFSFTPDMSDPEIKKEVTRLAMSGASMLFSPPAPAAALPALPPALGDEPELDDIDQAMPTIDASAPTTSTPAHAAEQRQQVRTAAAASVPAPAAATATAPDLRQIAEAKPKKTGKHPEGSKRAGQAWTLYEIAATTGECWSTFSETAFKTALEAKEKGWPVRIVDEPSERYPDQMDLKSITLVDPRQPSLPMAGDNF
jgi:hypothetical protein